MSLQGSFETIALREVMALLASSNKSGELRVVGGQLEGRLWLDDGRLVASHVGKARDYVEAIFELMCLTEGNFVFKDGVLVPDTVLASELGEPMAIEPVVRQAEERLHEWRDIERIVPSLDHRVRLVPDLPTPEVTLTADDWRLVMAVALAGTVRGVLDELSLSHFDCCRGIRRLVDAGLVVVEPPRVRPSSADPARLARRSVAANGSHGPADGAVRSPRLARRSPLVAEGHEVVVVAAPGFSALSPVADGGPVEDDSGDPEVVYFPLPDDGYDTSQFAIGEEPLAAVPPLAVPAQAVRTQTERLSVPWDEPEPPVPHSDSPAAESRKAESRKAESRKAESRKAEFPDRELAAAVAAAVAAARGAAPVARAAGAAVVPVATQAGPVAGPDVPAAAPGGRPEKDADGDPINRGLLLKFLSSVRS